MTSVVGLTEISNLHVLSSRQLNTDINYSAVILDLILICPVFFVINILKKHFFLSKLSKKNYCKCVNVFAGEQFCGNVFNSLYCWKTFV